MVFQFSNRVRQALFIVLLGAFLVQPAIQLFTDESTVVTNPPTQVAGGSGHTNGGG